MSEDYVEDQDSDTGYEEQPVSDLDTPEVAEDEESYSPALSRRSSC